MTEFTSCTQVNDDDHPCRQKIHFKANQNITF